MRLVISFAILALAAISLPGASVAGKNAGGSLVVHVDDSAIYTATQDYCSEQWLPPMCEDAETQSNASPENETVIWVLAAFPELSSPAVTGAQFGVEHSMPPGQGYVPHWGPCGPNPLVLPDQGFPDVPGGTLLAYGQPVYGGFFSIMWFGVYWNVPGDFFRSAVYPAIGQALLTDDSVPPVVDVLTHFGEVRWQEQGYNECLVGAPGACCYPDGSCEFLTDHECDGVFMGHDLFCTPDLCFDFRQACCFADGSCEDLLPEDCVAQGGTPMGEGTDCTEVDCGPPPQGACCLPDGTCQFVFPFECDAQGGTFYGNEVPCVPSPCPQACCLPDGGCEDLGAEDCVAQGGEPKGEGTRCTTTDCEVVATEPSTWGQIKASYR